MKPKKLIARRVTPGALVGCPFCTIIPAHMMRGLAQNGDDKQRSRALSTMLGSHRLRGQRDMLGVLGAVALMTPAGVKRRTIYDSQQQPSLPGKLVRGEGGAKGKDVTVNEAYDYSGAVYDFFSTVLGRNSIDDRGMRLDSSVHFREDPTEPFDNAFWNGTQMIYGDGDGASFGRFTKCLDVVGHELTHGITQYEAGLEYQGQSGALNESFSDVFGSLVKQWKKKQKADKADWLIGKGLLAKGVNGVALRSLKAPGTAYDDPLFGGKDPQPAHMKDYVKLANTNAGDNGGVHINSGIPNHAFYLVATKLGGNAWAAPGKIWYDALCNRIRSKATFKDAAKATVASASSLYGSTSPETKAVKAAWQEVGVL
jgi:Zn-dependent metalloprotease